MRIKSVIKYNLSEMKASIIIFYGVMVAVWAFFGILFVSISGDRTGGNSGGAEVATAIFIFVAGLNSFKNNYLFLSANGISRKTQFMGFVSGAFIICVILSLIDGIYSNILPQFVNYETLFHQLYYPWADTLQKLQVIITGFIWGVSLYFLAIASGYFITILYYRMNKILKIAVSITAPSLLFVVLPIVDDNYAKGKISDFLWITMRTLGGFTGEMNPFTGVLSMTGGAVIILGLAYLLVRKAGVKD